MANTPKVWLITGASRGLGRDLARAALDRGEVVVGTSRDGRGELDPGPGQFRMIPLDVTQPDQAEGAVREAHRLHGRIDVLVNNAGSGLLGALEESTDAEAAEVFAVNFFGPLRLIRAALPLMRAQRGGHVVNLSSIAGLAPGAGSSLYAAAKFALEGMSQSLAQEVGPLGIRVTVVEPGAFRTDFLSGKSIRLSPARIEDYDATSGRTIRYLESIDGKQLGDPALGALAIIEAVESADPPLNLILGTDALDRARARLARFVADVDRWEHLTRSTDHRQPAAEARP